MKIYDTVNGNFVSEMEVEKSDIVLAVLAGEYDENQMENWTIEGNDIGNSTQLRDLMRLGYAYFTGANGTVIACSDGRHVDTVWNRGCWDEGDETEDREVWADRLERLKAEMNAGEAWFQRNKITLSDAEVEQYHKAHRDALEFAFNCVDDEIAEPYEVKDKYSNPPREAALDVYVGTHR